jgi:predicted ester cyclase
MPTQAQAKVIERYSTEVWGQGNLDAIDDIFTPDRVRHGPDLEGGTSEGSQSHKELVTLYRTALPDLKVPIEAMAGEGDIVLTRWAAWGTNDGPMLGKAPTGKAMRIFGFWMHRFEGNKIAEEWATWDTHGFLQQLGVSLP